MRIIVDADACPRQVLNTCVRLGSEYRVPIITVASFNHCLQGGNHIVVGNSPEEVDYKIANLATSADLVVTQDFGLASVVLGKGARALSPVGREYRPETIAFLLEERQAKARFRRGGGRTKGLRKRSPCDDRAFVMALKRILDVSQKP